MARITWDKIGEKFYETGTKMGVIYIYDKKATDPKKVYHEGHPWNGLTGVTEKPSGAEATDLWANDAKYATMLSAEKFGCSIEAYTYPKVFAECDGVAEIAPGMYIGQQNRKTFGFTYRTTIGNDLDGNDHAYKLHIVYGCLASPSEKGRKTINDSPEAITFTWEVNTTPVSFHIKGKKFKPTSYIEFDSRDFTEETKYKLEKLENILYGGEDENDEQDAYLPLPEEIYEIMNHDRTLSTLTVQKEPTKKVYNLHEEMDLTGLEVLATYDDGSTKLVTDYTVTGFDSTTVGTKTCTIHYQDKTATFTVEVKDNRVLQSIAITTKPTKVTYKKGETLNTAGMVVTATYTDGSTATVTGWTTSGFDSSTTGTKTVTVTYTKDGVSKTATFQVTVTEQ